MSNNKTSPVTSLPILRVDCCHSLFLHQDPEHKQRSKQSLRNQIRKHLWPHEKQNQAQASLFSGRLLTPLLRRYHACLLAYSKASCLSLSPSLYILRVDCWHPFFRDIMLASWPIRKHRICLQAQASISFGSIVDTPSPSEILCLPPGLFGSIVFPFSAPALVQLSKQVFGRRC